MSHNTTKMTRTAQRMLPNMDLSSFYKLFKMRWGRFPLCLHAEMRPIDSTRVITYQERKKFYITICTFHRLVNSLELLYCIHSYFIQILM